MKSSVFHRGRAARFAQLLDEADGARRRHVRAKADADLADYVEVSHRLARIDYGAQAEPEFRDGLRAMLMATIERDGIGVTAVDTHETVEVRDPRHRPAGVGSRMSWIPVQSRRARGAVVIGLAVSTLTVSGMSAASGDAIPGDALYGMKRSTERAQLALASSQVGRGQLYLEFAKTRMNEAAAVRGDAPGLAGVLEDMDNETKQGVRLLTTSAVDRHDPTALDAVTAFTDGQQRTMTGMLGALTGGARARTVGSLNLLDQINQRVAGLRTGLRCGDAESGRTDDLGPVPRRCAALGPVRSSNAGAADSTDTATGGTWS